MFTIIPVPKLVKLLIRRYYTAMQVTVFGASGRVGQEVVAELNRRGHTVIAVVHSHSPFTNTPALRTFTGDVHNADDIAQAMQGSQAVISALGSWGTVSKDILSAAMTHIVPSMHAQGISRLVSLTGADARFAGDQLTMLHRISYRILRLIAGDIIRDGEKHMVQLAASKLTWTVVRAPIMTNSQSRTFRLTNTRPLPWATVPRRAVALALVENLENLTHACQAPFISRA